MIAALLITFREGLEAALIVGIIFGYLKKTGQQTHNRFVWTGVAMAVVASIAVALGIQAVGAELEGRAEEIFEGITMFLAVGVLTWMIFWMRYQSRTLKTSIEHDIEHAVSENRGRGLILTTFLVVFREGVETALFLSAAAFVTNSADTLVGAISGLAMAVLIGYLIYASTVRLNVRMFFNVTSVLLLVFAAGLFAHGIHEFQEAGIFPIVTEHLWNTNHLLDEDSQLGQILKAVIGYNGNPSLLEVVGYWSYWLLALFGVQWYVERKFTQTAEAVPST